MGLIKYFFPGEKKIRKKSRKKSYVPESIGKVRVGQTIPDPRVNDANTDLSRYKDQPTTPEVLRAFAKVSPDLANAVNNYLRLGITKQFTVTAKSMDGRIDVEATENAQIVINRMNYMATSYQGFNMPGDLKSVSESLMLQLVLNGNMMVYLDLDDAYLPRSLVVVPTNYLKFKRGPKNRLIPYLSNMPKYYRTSALSRMLPGGGKGSVFEMDSPLYLYASIDQDVNQVYADPFLNAAIQPIIESTNFNTDLKKSFRKASLPRLTTKIDVEKWKETLPPDVLYDADKLEAAINTLITEISTKINGLEPDEALVYFDSIDVQHMTFGYSTSHNSIRAQSDNINSQISSGVKTLPSLLGRGEYATSSSIEAMVYLQNITSIQQKLNSLYSRVLTLSLRLMGYDVIVDFKYGTPELRPTSELESFFALRQSRILEQLSLGFISDEEAALSLTGDLPSGNFTPLSGTGFRSQSGDPGGNPYSNTSVSADAGGRSTAGENAITPKDKNPKTNKTAG